MTKSPPNPPTADEVRAKHLRITEPSPWIERFQHLVPKRARVLDVAAGGGRHGRRFLKLGAKVTFIDRNTQALGDLADNPVATVIEADLEDGVQPFGGGGPLAAKTFDAVVVVNYLHRPLINPLIDALRPDGILIYETFARGNEKFARPRNPDHLLRSGELLAAVLGKMQVVAYEHGRIEGIDIPGVKQRLCAIKDLENPTRGDDGPPTHPLAPT